MSLAGGRFLPLPVLPSQGHGHQLGPVEETLGKAAVPKPPAHHHPAAPLQGIGAGGVPGEDPLPRGKETAHQGKADLPPVGVPGEDQVQAGLAVEGGQLRMVGQQKGELPLGLVFQPGQLPAEPLLVPVPQAGAGEAQKGQPVQVQALPVQADRAPFFPGPAKEGAVK